MIEVEKKFIITEEQESRLLQGAEFLGERTFTDTYYDTSGFNLTMQDIWLRKRENEFQLKLPLAQGALRIVDQYQEVNGEDKIREVFALPRIKTFTDDIIEFGYQPFCILTTTRRKYKKGKFILDFDVVRFDDFELKICEIELMVEEKKQIEEAISEVLKFAGEFKLKPAPVRGKVIEYLARKKPLLYQALVESGVVTNG